MTKAGLIPIPYVHRFAVGVEAELGEQATLHAIFEWTRVCDAIR